MVLQFRYAKFTQALFRYFCFILVFPCIVKAENTFMDWEVQLYGGEYYEDKRIGSYSIASKSFLNDFSITGEFMSE